VWRVGGLEVVLRPGGLLLMAGLATLFDVRCWQLAAPAAPTLGAHVAATVMTVLIGMLTALHESGHALAFRAQGAWPVRITLHGGGGACAAVVVEDSAGRALVRALAGPAVAALAVTLWLTLCRGLPLAPVWRLAATTVTAVGLCNVLIDLLPLHPRSDGVQALRAVVWLGRRRQPDRVAVLYLWRPLILAALALLCPPLGVATGVLPVASAVTAGAALVSLVLCLVPAALLARRALALCARAPLALPTATGPGACARDG
jgi:peptidoglycan/LPS O-acetylase OafA/YrhL